MLEFVRIEAYLPSNLIILGSNPKFVSTYLSCGKVPHMIIRLIFVEVIDGTFKIREIVN